MRKDEAERAIVAEMRRRLPQIPYRGADGGLAEYERLRQDRPELFDFRSGGGDQWQLVSAWMRKHHLTA
jgi:hypothetical protein